MSKNLHLAAVAGVRPAVSDEVYRGLVDAVVDHALFRLDAEGRVVSWNSGARNIKGYAEDEILGRHFSCFFTEEDRAARVPEIILKTARTLGRYESEGWRVRKDGGRFWALAVVDAIYDRKGAVIGFAKITRDMSERRDAEAALRRSERQFRLLVEGVKDYALCMLDPRGMVTSWNAGAERIKGYSAEEAVGRHFSLFYTDEDAAAGLPEVALDTARATGRYEADGWRVRKDGARFWANVVVDAIWDETGELLGFAKITRDMTERRETRLRLEETRQQLVQAQKMDAVGQLTGGVAHDFNNLLTAITGGLEMARLRIHEPARLQVLLGSVGDAVQRGASLTKHLLAFSRRQALNPETFSLKAMLPEFVELLERSLGRNIEIELAADDEVCVHADRHQLELALLNIGLNARDAMPAGGRILLKAERRALDEPMGPLKGDFVAISLSDTGVGIPSELLERVFEPFFTTKEVGQGTGLGLSQAYGFAQQSGGALQIESEFGGGATVTFLLPEALAAAASVVWQADEADRDLKGQRILLVEDDPSVAGVTRSLLEEAGAQVAHALDVSQALAALEGAEFDLVFSDVVMPGGRSGFDLARQLAQARPDLPVLLTTGYCGGGQRPASEFKVLSKPYVPAELFHALSECLAQTSPPMAA